MPSVTLAEAAKLQNNVLVQGVIESIVTVNQVYNVMPFDQIVGNAIEYNRENALGGVDVIGVGGDDSVNVISAQAKTAATFTAVTSSLKVILGDAYVDHFVQTTMNSPNDQKAIQVASKAKGIARQFQDLMVTGDNNGDSKQFDGLQILVPTAQKVNYSSTIMTLDMLDELMAMVKSKDGEVDFFMMPINGIRKYYSLLRALGGAGINETVQIPGGGMAPAYRGVPIFRNDWIPITGSPNKVGDVYCGVWDDGSRQIGLAGLTSSNQSGIFVTELGEAEGTNNTITRVRFYAGLALFSQLGIARGQSIRFQ
jgi:hypothetical protein